MISCRRLRGFRCQVSGFSGSASRSWSSSLPRSPRRGRLPRFRAAADGKPDLSGIWQVLNTAAWDIQDHAASLGVPARTGRGRRATRFRTSRRRWRGKRENFAEPPDGRSGNEVLPTGRAARHLHAASVSDRSDADHRGDPLTSTSTSPATSTWTARRTRRDRSTTGGWAIRAARWEGNTLVVDVIALQRSRPGSIGPAISTATRCTWSNATRQPIAITSLRGDDRGSEGVHAAVEDEHAAVPPAGAQRPAPGLRKCYTPARGTKGRPLNAQREGLSNSEQGGDWSPLVRGVTHGRRIEIEQTDDDFADDARANRAETIAALARTSASRSTMHQSGVSLVPAGGRDAPTSSALSGRSPMRRAIAFA